MFRTSRFIPTTCGSALLGLAVLLTVAPASASENQRAAPPRHAVSSGEVTLLINHRIVTVSPSFVSGNRALVALFSSPQPGPSLSSLLAGSGTKSSFERASGTVIFVKGGTAMTMTIGNPHLDVDGKRRALDSAPILFRNRVLVPIRAVAEASGLYVEWFGPHRLVVVSQRAPEAPADGRSSFWRRLWALVDPVTSHLASFFGLLWGPALDFLVLLLIIWLARWLQRRFLGRAQVQVVPFSAPDYRGFPEHTVTIFAALMEELASQARLSDSLARTAGYLGTAKGPVLIYPELGDIAVISRVLSVADKGKVVTALIEAITRPEFRISGSVVRADTDADVGVQVARDGKHYWGDTDRRPQTALSEATADLGFQALCAIESRLQS